MTDDWFSEYVYEVVVDKRFLSCDVLEVMQQEPIVLPAWDPMGALAQLWKFFPPSLCSDIIAVAFLFPGLICILKKNLFF